MITKNKIGILREESLRYPSKDTLFRVDKPYPECPFEDKCETNSIYAALRELFLLYGLDKNKFNNENWNPFGDFINEGDTVVIKPNMVLDRNPIGGVDCLYTHPSLVAVAIDYTIIALKGTGKIIVGDAPLQECDFENLVNNSGYSSLIQYYKDRNINIELIDFRNTKTYTEGGLHYNQKTEVYGKGVTVDMAHNSAFADLDDEKINNLRVTNYDPKIMNTHHNSQKHEYIIAEDIINADVIINIPKIKTHRLAGMTGAMKNLVGMNANKECLPHHRLGGINEGGDAYQVTNKHFNDANILKDRINTLNAEGNQKNSREIENEYKNLVKKGREESSEKYWNGFWYGNDTIWRTIVDLNKILIYSDKNGIIKTTPQRRMFIIGDMVIAGENEGPLMPVSKICNTLLVGTNPVLFDRVAASLMGYDYKLLPTLNNAHLTDEPLKLLYTENVEIVSNMTNLFNKTYSEILEDVKIPFEPVKGWLDILPSHKFKKTIEELRNAKKIYIFGAGIIGVEAYEELKYRGIKIDAFVDNDKLRHNEIVIDNVKCISPQEMDKDSICIIAVGSKNINTLYEQVKNMDVSTVYRWQEMSI